jgi:hypothetical protein
MPHQAPQNPQALLGIALAASLALAAPALAEVPDYATFELQARSNIVDGFNLPAGSSFNSGTIALNDAAQVAFRLVSVGTTGRGGIWFGAAGNGEVVYTAPPDPIVADPSINNLGLVAFEQYDFGGSDGVFIYDPAAGDTTLAVPPGGPFGHLFLASPQINDAGQIGFRGKDGGNRQGFYADDAGSQARYVAETSIDPQSPFAFLFTPSFNGNSKIAGKGRIGGTGGSQPDEIRLWLADGSSTLIVEDDDGDPASPYSSFDNGVDLTDADAVAFIANLAAGGRGVFLSDGTTTIEIATTNDPDVSDIEFFHPAANSAGLVAFRGKDGQGLQAIFVGDGTTLRRVIGEHDLVPTDLGDARIDQHDSSVVFGGGVDINEGGDIGFACTLTPPDNNQIEWGSGMFIAYADAVLPGDVDGDGDVDQADLGALLSAYNACDGDPNYNANADFDNSGCIDQADLGTLLANYTG